MKFLKMFLFMLTIFCLLCSCKNNIKNAELITKTTNATSTCSITTLTTKTAVEAAKPLNAITLTKPVTYATTTKKMIKIDLPIKTTASFNSSSKTTTTTKSKYQNIPMPIVKYTKNDDPYKVFTETIDRTNKCPMYYVLKGLSYTEKFVIKTSDDVYKSNSYTLTHMNDVGLHKNQLYRDHCIDTNGLNSSRIPTGYINGYMINGYNILLNHYPGYEEGYIAVSLNDYKSVFPFYDQQPVDFVKPNQSEIITKSIKEKPYNGDQVEVTLYTNEDYFNRGLNSYKSTLFQDNAFNFTFISTSITLSSSMYSGVVHYLTENTSFSYDVVSNGQTKTWVVTMEIGYIVGQADNYHTSYKNPPAELEYLFD